MSVVWKKPPERRSSQVNWAAVGRQLRANPGEWAQVAVKDTLGSAVSLVTYLRWGRRHTPSPLGEGTWQVERRDTAVYARYLAEPDGGES